MILLSAEEEMFLMAQNTPTQKAFSVPVDFVGQDEVRAHLKQIHLLAQISLTGARIGDPGPDEELKKHVPGRHSHCYFSL
jgi:hypothetical protein